MKELSLDRLLASRRSWVDAGKFRFHIQRPTMLDIVRSNKNSEELSIEFAARFVVGWEGVSEHDIIPGGDPDPAEFSHDVFCAWIADRPDLWRAIAGGIEQIYRAHEEQTADRGNA